MVRARQLTNCSNTLRNIHTNARENITGTRAKWKAGYFFMAHPVCVCVCVYIYIYILCVCVCVCIYIYIYIYMYIHTHTHTNGSTNFTKIRSHLKILGARNVT